MSKNISPIHNFVCEKINQLKWFDGHLRWDGGRIYFESTKLLNEIESYSVQTQISILELLHNEIANSDITIQDNWPLECPDVTDQFVAFLKQHLNKLQISNIDSIEIKEILGFSCSLSEKQLLEVYLFMTGQKSNEDDKYIKCSKNDFLRVFHRGGCTYIDKPIKWLLLGRGGTKSKRGNQTALFVFLEQMLGNLTNTDLRKSKDLFVDSKGPFIKTSLTRPDKTKINSYGFENTLNSILKRADHFQ